MNILNTEIVFRGHPDKLADQISDSILVEYLKIDKNAKVNVDVVGGGGTVFITGEAYASRHVDIPEVVKNMLADVGCCPNADIVDEVIQEDLDAFQDLPVNLEDFENVFYGYACNETDELLPKGMVILQEIAKAYEKLRKRDNRFLADGKVRMEGLYNEQGDLIRIISMDINHQNKGIDNDDIDEIMREMVLDVVNKYDVQLDELVLNSFGAYKIGGFDRDTGLTGRKLEIDNYHGYFPSGKMTLSGKNLYSIRSAAYKARQIAKDILKRDNLGWVSVQLTYDSTGKQSKPFEILIDSNKGEINVPQELYEECSPENIVRDLNLIEEDLVNLSSFGHIQ